MQLRIRPANAFDLPAILAIERTSFASAWTAQSFQAELDSPHSRLWVAAASHAPRRIIGYICFHWLVDEIYILNLAVATGFRGQGVASALLRLALRWGRRHGGKKAALEVRASNKEAVSLYECFGFRPVHVRENYYGLGSPALVMTRLLSPPPGHSEI